MLYLRIFRRLADIIQVVQIMPMRLLINTGLCAAALWLPGGSCVATLLIKAATIRYRKKEVKWKEIQFWL